MLSTLVAATPAAIGDDAVQIVVDGELYLTQSDLWSNKIFAVGDRVISLIPGSVGQPGMVIEINRREPEKFTPYDDLIVVWANGKRDCLYFNQVGKRF